MDYMRILMVEDEKYMAESIAQILKRNHYSVDLSYDGKEGLYYGLLGVYDIIILDIMLPQMNGIEVLKQLRNSGIVVPILLLTAKGETEDKVIGLDNGADDYLAKPFQVEELLARLRALSRRKSQWIEDGILECENIQLNPNNLMLRNNEKGIKLTLKEAQILELLIKRKGYITSKDRIIEKVWGYESETEDNHVEVYISFLRKKLKHMSADIYIQTIRGAGYVLKVVEGKEGQGYV